MSRDITHRKSGAAIPLGEECGSAAVFLSNRLSFWATCPSERHFEALFGQTSPVRLFLDSPTLRLYDALCLNVIVPGVLRIPIDVVVMNGDLRDVIRDGWGSRPDCAVQVDRRGMDFWRRS